MTKVEWASHSVVAHDSHGNTNNYDHVVIVSHSDQALAMLSDAAGQHFRLRILETDDEGPLLAATFNGRRRALNTVGLLRAFFALPLATLKIMAAIHWEALLLWVKGARLVPRQNAAHDPRLAAGEKQRLYFAGVVCPPQRVKQSVDHAKPAQAAVRRIADARVDFAHVGNGGRSCFRNCPAWPGWRWASAQSCNTARST